MERLDDMNVGAAKTASRRPGGRAETPSGSALSATQQHVLETLMRRGEATADELAISLDISASAVRQHLAMLKTANLVSSRLERGRPGRPVGHYRATQQAEPLFVTSDASLSLELLELIEEEDPRLIEKVFERRRNKLLEEAADQLAGMSIPERVDAVAELLVGQGYHADAEQLEPGHYRINLHSCAIWSVASHYRQACLSELEFIAELLPGATVERVSHKTAGAHTCAYEISVA